MDSVSDSHQVVYFYAIDYSMAALEKEYPGKRIFITGAGSGLGRSLSVYAAKKGWTVGVTDLNASALAETVKLLESHAVQVYSYVFDVGDRMMFEKSFEQFTAAAGGIDVMVNNAGVGDGSAFTDYSLDNWEWMIRINQMGVLYGCHFAARKMKQQGSGCIVNIASAAAIAQLPEMSMYNMTKSAVRSLSETLYAELKPGGIHVLCVMPTFFRTQIMQHARGGDKALKRGHQLVSQSPVSAEEMAAKIWESAEKREPYLIYPSDARRVFRLSRWFPVLFLRVKAWIYARPEWQERLLYKRKED